MCRRKPGPRCHQHSLNSLEAAKRRVVTTAAAVKRATTDQTRQEAEERFRQAAHTLIWAERDFDGTQVGRETLNDAIDRLPEGAARDGLVKRAVGAQTLRSSRLEQAKLMPPLPTGQIGAQAVACYNDLGRVREELARWEAADVLGEHPDAAQARRAREWLETDAFNNDVAFRVSAAGGADLTQLDPTEAKLLAIGDPTIANRITYLSHARAAVAAGNHPDRVARIVEAKDAALAADITTTAPPSSAAPGGPQQSYRQPLTPTAAAAYQTRASGRREATYRPARPPQDTPDWFDGLPVYDRAGAMRTERLMSGAARALNSRSRGKGGDDLQVGKYLSKDVVGGELQVN